MKTTWTRACVLLTALTGPTGPALAGPLTPPPGPVTPTNKTLQQVEPRTPIESLAGNATSMHKITQPGSYYLTGNIALAPGKTTCIEIGVDGVTIDLNGFTLNGLNSVGTVAIRVEDKFFCDGMLLINGHITDWETGVAGTGFVGMVVDSVRFTFCDIYGLDAGNNATVTRCSATVGGTGFYLRDGGSISNSTAAFFGRGFDLGNGGGAADCRASLCAEGFYLNFGSTARACGATESQIGFRGADRNTLVDCDASFCNDGIALEQASRVSGCHVGGGSGPGIVVSHGSTVERCTVNGQGLRGISAGDKCSIRDNNVEFCGGNGIHVFGHNTMLVGNNVQRCQLDIGVFIEGNDNQLEMNRIEGSGLDGVKVIGERNLVIRNRICSSSRVLPGAHSDYNFAPGNYIGTILLPGPFVTTTEANANFSCGVVPAGAPLAVPGAGPESPARPTGPAGYPGTDRRRGSDGQ
ncbi:MAG: right-handed parallel beta-helix repeat-containing protein [Phycisphaerales bacterium]